MRRGWELRIAAALCAGMAGCLSVSSGCSTLVSGNAAAHFSRWQGTAPASATPSESPDTPMPVVTVASLPEEPADELPAAADRSAVGETVPTPSAELAMDDVLAYTLENHPALCLREQEVQLARARLTAAGRQSTGCLPADLLGHRRPIRARMGRAGRRCLRRLREAARSR
jgi:hypothetical protein